MGKIQIKKINVPKNSRIKEIIKSKDDTLIVMEKKEKKHNDKKTSRR